MKLLLGYVLPGHNENWKDTLRFLKENTGYKMTTITGVWGHIPLPRKFKKKELRKKMKTLEVAILIEIGY